MTKDEIKLVVFILSAILAGALVQNYRTSLPLPPAPPPPPHGWAKPPYVLKEKKSSRSKTAESDPDAQ
jgi:hypothetical protein